MRDVVEFGEVKIKKIASKEIHANMFTKSLPRLRFKLCL